MSDSPRPHDGLADLERSFQQGDFDEVRRSLRELDEEGRQLLEAQLGAASVRQLRRLSRGTRSQKRGRVIVLHGVMGSNLDVKYRDGDVDEVWLNYWKLVWGGFSDLEMKLDGSSAKNVTVQVTGQYKSYLPLTLGLSRRWDVLPFAYDWRQDIRKSAALLDQCIRKWAGDEPVHLVAHSMGGLVSRRFIHDFGSRWSGMADAVQEGRGGRLIMLGTPNKGSYDIPLTLTGQDKLIKKLATWSTNSLKDIQRVIGKFPGVYQMLPSPKLDLQDDHDLLFRKKSWGSLPVHQKFLTDAQKFHEDLHAVGDVNRLHYIAGYGQDTPYQVDIVRPGTLKIFSTKNGDGRVPHKLGLLDGVSTHWVRELHGDLPGNDTVIEAVDDLLSTGKTQALSASRPARRGKKPEELEVWSDEAGEARLDQAFDALKKTSKRRAAKSESADTLRRAARAQQLLVEDYLGTAGEDGVNGDGDESPGEADERPHIKVSVLWSDIAKCKADVVCVGHYRGVMPQYAEAALDKVVSADDGPRLLASLTERGVLIGALGEVQFFPWREHPERLVAIAGMGYPGQFTESRLRVLARNLAWAVGRLPNASTVATVLIGSGEGSLPLTVALRGLFDGLADALREGLQDTKHHTLQLQIVEFYVHKAERIQKELKELAEAYKETVILEVDRAVRTGAGGQVANAHGWALSLAAQAAAAADSSATERRLVDGILEWVPSNRRLRDGALDALKKLGTDHETMEVADLADELDVSLGSRQSESIPTRISFTRDGNKLRTAAITNTTVVRERVSGLNPDLVRQLMESATDPDPENVSDLARMLHSLLVPPDLKAALTARSSVVIEVDRFMAGVHWELMNPDPDRPGSERRHIGLDLQVSRQLRTEYSTPPAPQPGARTTERKALVIGDPDGSLPGARWEAERVGELLDDQFEVTTLIGPNSETGNPFRGDGASVFKVLHFLNKHSFDLLHYSGHGDFDPEDPTRVGWVFHDGLLTADELQTVPHVPSLVVANACLSGRLSEVGQGSLVIHEMRRDNALLPSLADEFFRRGVQSYVGTAWEVDDDGAVMFAEKFYEVMLARDPENREKTKPIGEAMLEARRELEREFTDSALWLAYQHYGMPSFRLE